MKVGKGVVLTGAHEKEVTDVTWTQNGDLVAISDDFQARCWRNGFYEQGDGWDKAMEMREAGENEVVRWEGGWVDKVDY